MSKIIFSHDVVFNESEGHASTEKESREREEYIELDISENDSELSENILDQPELAEPVWMSQTQNSHCQTVVVRLNPRNSQTTMAGAHILLQNLSEAPFQK